MKDSVRNLLTQSISRRLPSARKPSLRGRLSVYAMALCLLAVTGLMVGLGSSALQAQPTPAPATEQAQDPGTSIAPPAGEEPAAAPTATTAGTLDEEKLSIDWMKEMAKGGVTAIIQMLLGVAMIAFAIERFLSVRANHIAPAALLTKLRPLWPRGEFKTLQAECKADGSVLAQVINYMIKHRRVPMEVMTIGAGDVAARELKRHIQRAYPLAVIATLEPLLGLLGTIIGMVEAFNKVAVLGDTGDASMLADAIGKALITTAVGLILAIPALALYHYFRQRISLLGTILEEQVEELVSYWLLGVDSTEEVKDGASTIGSGPVVPDASSQEPPLRPSVSTGSPVT